MALQIEKKFFLKTISSITRLFPRHTKHHTLSSTCSRTSGQRPGPYYPKPIQEQQQPCQTTKWLRSTLRLALCITPACHAGGTKGEECGSCNTRLDYALRKRAEQQPESRPGIHGDRPRDKPVPTSRIAGRVNRDLS